MSFQPLANAELAVMEVIWDAKGPVTARQIREQLYPGTDRTQHGTIQRLLQRLEDKGFIDRDDQLPVHLFTGRISRDDYAGSQLESLAAKLTGGSIAPLITHLIDQQKISPSELDRLRAILDDTPPKEDER